LGALHPGAGGVEGETEDAVGAVTVEDRQQLGAVAPAVEGQAVDASQGDGVGVGERDRVAGRAAVAERHGEETFWVVGEPEPRAVRRHH
jgi:hypothetical protein